MTRRQIGAILVCIGTTILFLSFMWEKTPLQLLPKLPSLLGFNGKMTYLILFQNNYELRPTGGFMGSYGLLTFDRGKPALTVEDIYVPDGQVTSHIDSPEPIQEAFQLGTWRLRDANWNPDFPESAKTIEWFFDKAGISQIDGVIATNLSTFQKLLKLVEPVSLTDYSEKITENNVWEKAQFYSQENFFPGSKQKREFLSDLSKEVLKKLDSSFIKKVQAAKVLYQALSEKQILLYFNDQEVQKPFESLNWAGAVEKPRCLPWLPSCVADSLFVVEANLGVNKANCCIERKEELFVTIDGSQVHHKLQVTLTNNSSQFRWGGRYKAWIRIIYGEEEKGLWVEVPEGKTHVVTIEYETKNNGSSGPYVLSIQKQSGIDGVPFMLHITRNGNTQSISKDIMQDDLFVL